MPMAIERITTIASAMIALLVSTQRANADRVQEDHACAVVLGLDPSEASYRDCIDDLERNLRPADPARAANAPSSTRQKAGAACADAGLKEGSLAYSRCVVDIDQSLSAEQSIYR